MADAILVLNAGSSSVKFQVFVSGAQGLAPLMRGQIEALFTAPKFEAKDAAGRAIESKAWELGTELGHAGALAFLVEFLTARKAEYELRAVGHRVVHGGTAHTAPVLVDEGVLERLDQLVPLAPLHQPHNLAPIRALMKLRPGLPRSPASTRRSIPPSRHSRRASRCRPRSPTAAFGATGSMDCPTSTSRPCCRRWTRAPPAGAPSCSTSATAPACAR
jgi:hypothetical protein